VEVEAFAVANLVSKIEAGRLDAAPVWTDIKTFPAQAFRNRVHIVTGGYPCQGESHAGKRLGKDDPRWLWPYIERIVQTVRPLWCFFENVPGHLSLGFPEVYRSLRLMGYKVEAGLFDAKGGIEEGQRLFILAQTESFKRSLLLQSGKQKQADFDAGRSGKILGKTYGKGLQRHRCSKQRRRAEFGKSSLTVAPQGAKQYAWEAQRFVKSELDRTTHGPSGRVDRLRLLGNGVVPAQAEIAFRELRALFEI